MTDGYGREIDYLRISLTDKCNLRCSYCMPREGIRHIEHGDILTLEEIGRLARIMAELGIRRVRLTGGEPLVRRGITDLIKILREECGFNEISMTSNGVLLADMAEGLYDVGLTDINISLDTLREDCFSLITRSEGSGLICTLDGIDSALEAGLRVKLNCVPMRGINE
ncbi:MAG: radical SAM protein, partial [Lachnospiraceae bacterium]|nr:radical SAM protein [Lachnospiraceae bacterium]